MDDLNGLEWSSSPNSSSKTKPHTASTNSYSQFKTFPTLSPQSTNPISRPGSTRPLDFQTPSPGPPSNDSFSNLVAFGAKKNGTGNGSLSLLEQQKRLQEDRVRQEEEKRKLFDKQFGGLDSLTGNGVRSNGTGGSAKSVGSPLARSSRNDSDDLLAAFSADAKVDKSSYYPPPKSGQGTPARGTTTPQISSSLGLDLFDVSNLPSTEPSPMIHATKGLSMQDDEDDDILGMLGKPMSALPPRPPPKPERNVSLGLQPGHTNERSLAKTPPPGKDPRDPAIAELMDMGFPMEDAKRALAETDTGLDVRAAIDYLLHQAHGKTNSRKHPNAPSRRDTRDEDAHDERQHERRKPREREISHDAQKLAWEEEQKEQDILASATQIGGNLLKTAGSLWNTSRKRVVKAVNEFQQPGSEASSDGMPKWMRDAQREQENGERQKQRPVEDNMTDEAMMLEMGAKRKERERKEKMWDQDGGVVEQREMDARDRERRREAELRERKAKLSREVVESESAQAYISPARRRNKPAAAATPSPVPLQPTVAEGDLLFGNASIPKISSAPPTAQSRQPSMRTTSSNHVTPRTPQPPQPMRTAAVKRDIPSISQRALSSSLKFRNFGTELFKKGDYPAALTHYTSALGPIPETHPIRYVILSNRALTQIKLGDSKAAVADCEEIITGIGINRGEGETIDTGDGTFKDLKEFWGKAVVRRAEALEHLERWSDAAQAWQLAIESGVGGATANAGKARSEKALAPKPTPKPKLKPAARPPPSKPVSLRSAPPTTAVTALRAANLAADRVDSEKFALHDVVEAKVTAWKGGKEQNLRALLSSLDNVLWEGAGWKKVGLHELVMPNKVKIAYMKGIGKVHPDKVPASATTEQKMLSAAVFSTLNEAWDDFKKQNNL